MGFLQAARAEVRHGHRTEKGPSSYSYNERQNGGKEVPHQARRPLAAASSLVRESMIDTSYSNCLLVMIWAPGRPHSKPASHVGDPARGAAGLSEDEWEWAGSA